jgi:type I restriction enzyme S subunit
MNRGEFKFSKELGCEIPKEWKVCRLEDACLEITDGSHFSPKENKNGNYRIATVVNIRANQIDADSCKKISKEDYEKLVENGCKPQLGNVLFSKDGTVGLSFSFKQNLDLVLLSSIAIIRPKDILDSDFCAYILKAPAVFQKIVGSKRGTGLRRVILQDLKRIKIPLPEKIEEQRKIASILSTVDQAIQRVDEAITKTERLKRGLMQELLTRGIGHKEFKDTEIGRIPEEWGVVRINQISEVRRGASPRPIGSPKYFSNGGRGWVRISDVTDTYKYLRSTSQYLSQLGESKSVEVDPGDLIMSICATIGKPIIVDMQACIHDGFVVFRNLSSKISVEFLFYVLQRNELKFVNMKQTGTQGNLNTTLVGKTPIPLPTLPEQRKIAEILSIVDRKLELERVRKKKIGRIKRGLMNELLTGRRRVKT